MGLETISPCHNGKLFPTNVPLCRTSRLSRLSQSEGRRFQARWTGFPACPSPDPDIAFAPIRPDSPGTTRVATGTARFDSVWNGDPAARSINPRGYARFHSFLNPWQAMSTHNAAYGPISSMAKWSSRTPAKGATIRLAPARSAPESRLSCRRSGKRLRH